MKILLDTNFILTCVKQKIYFDSLADDLSDEKIEWIVLEDILDEIKKIKDKKGVKIKDREAANLSLKILKMLKPRIVKIKGKNPNVDLKIVDYLLGKDIVLATLDKDLKSRVKNKILTVRGKKSLEFI